MRTTWAAIVAVALATAGCTSTPEPDVAPDLATRIATHVQQFELRPFGLAVSGEDFAVLGESITGPDVPLWHPSPGYVGGVLSDGFPLALPATPAQFDVDALITAIDGRGDCDATGYLVAIGVDGPPLMVTGCGPGLSDPVLALGETTFSPADGWTSGDGIAFLFALNSALGHPRVADWSVSAAAASVSLVPDEPVPNWPCTTVTITFPEGLPAFACDQVQGQGAYLPRLGAGGGDLAGEVGSLLEDAGDGARAELVFTDTTDPRPLLQVGTAESSSSLAVFPADEEAAGAHDALPRAAAETWPARVGAWSAKGTSRLDAAQMYTTPSGSRPGDVQVRLERFGEDRALPLSLAGVSYGEASCRGDLATAETVCWAELGGGDYLVSSQPIKGWGTEPQSARMQKAADLLTGLKTQIAKG